MSAPDEILTPWHYLLGKTFFQRLPASKRPRIGHAGSAIGRLTNGEIERVTGRYRGDGSPEQLEP